MGLKNVTSIPPPPDSKTLERVATHIMHIQDLKVSVHKGNLTEFVKEYPPAKSYFELKATKFTMAFPQPGYIEGVKSKGKALMKMENCSWTYPKNTKPTVEGITVQVSLSSRVAILGPNGAGKSTMIKLLIGENIPQGGNVWKHPSVRVAYVAQHAFHLIENHLTKSPNEYIRWRYEIPGEDKEAIKKATMSLTEEEEVEFKKEVTIELKDEELKMYKVKGVIEKLSGLRKLNKQKEFEYQVKWIGKTDDANVFVPLSKLEKCGKLFMKLVKIVDEKIAAMTGMYVRPLTREMVEKQLEDVGLEPEYGTHTRMAALSGGQKVKVVFAAALWNQPHLVLLDEPTNYLDRESLGALAGAIETFEGGVVIISHNEEFTKKLCKETWLMEKDEATNIAHLNLQGDADWMQAALKAVQEKGPQEQVTEMVDAFGNKTAVTQKKKISKADLKKFKKKVAERRKDGEEIYTDEELETAGWIL
ncbi:P-loop containing nucleoside triphosphate hydrolase protein [Pavlovales sp. CCMP2436]|nr:P-loop containing nucleoside triphosphate hydrolase protein [Pavlovales sp. CCMP2436]